MIYNLVSCKKVIAKILTDLDLGDDSIRVSDIIEYLGDGMKKIGAFPALVTKVTGKETIPLLSVEDFQCKLPVDLHTINQVAFSRTANGPFYPMRYATGSFSFNHELSLPYPQKEATSSPDNQTTEHGTIWTSDHMYSVTGGWLKTNMRTGYILMSYQAIPIDDDFYPLIPDDESFFEALYWYVNMKLTYPEWKAGRVRDAVYYDTKSSWNFYRKQAYANAMMPNSDQLESIKNIWNRLVPNLNEDRTFYSTMGQQEIIKDKNTR